MRKRRSIYVLAVILLGILAIMPNVASYWRTNLYYPVITIVLVVFLAMAAIVIKK